MNNDGIIFTFMFNEGCAQKAYAGTLPPYGVVEYDREHVVLCCPCSHNCGGVVLVIPHHTTAVSTEDEEINRANAIIQSRGLNVETQTLSLPFTGPCNRTFKIEHGKLIEIPTEEIRKLNA